MSDEKGSRSVNITDTLAATGYWTARAAKYFYEGQYSRAVVLCKENLPHHTSLVSAHLIYARALYHAGQLDSAAEQLFAVLALDTDNIVALKYLGDLNYRRGDEFTAMSYYLRILELDPLCEGLKSDLNNQPSGVKETTRTITISRPGEKTPSKKKPLLRDIHFYTETVGDLYLAQGHPRLAAEVFRVLNNREQNPRLIEKLSKAEQKVKEKE